MLYDDDSTPIYKANSHRIDTPFSTDDTRVEHSLSAPYRLPYWPGVGSIQFTSVRRIRCFPDIFIRWFVIEFTTPLHDSRVPSDYTAKRKEMGRLALTNAAEAIMGHVCIYSGK